MDRSEQVFFYHLLADYDGILKVITLPGHECHLQVTAKSKLTILYRVSFREEVAFFYLLAFLNCRLQVDTSLLVRLDELGQLVYFQVFLKRDQLLLFATIVTDMDLVSIDEFNDTLTFRVDLDTRVTGLFCFQSRTDDRHFRTDQRHSLTLHVRSHQRTVGIIMLQERDQRSAETHDLVGSDVHIFYLS